METTDRTYRGLDYSRCVFCQATNNLFKTSKKLINPQEWQTNAYNIIEDDLKQLIKEGISLDLPFAVTGVNDLLGIGETFKSNKAKYHSNCRKNIRNKRLRKCQANKRKNENCDDTLTNVPKVKKTRLEVLEKTFQVDPVCFYCTGSNTTKKLCSMNSTDIKEQCKEWAIATLNWDVLRRLSTTQGSINYHASCYKKLNRDAHNNNDNVAQSEEFNSIGIAYLLLYIQHNTPPYKISDLKTKYTQYLKECISDTSPEFHQSERDLNTTRFKDFLLEKLGGSWHSLTQGRTIYVCNDAKTASLFEASCIGSPDLSNATMIVNAAMIIRQYTLASQPTSNFSFQTNCVEQSVPKPLLLLLDVLLYGPSADEKERDICNDARRKIALTLSQLIISNLKSKVVHRQFTNTHMRVGRITPFPLYVGIMLHTNGRQKRLIKQLYKYGISVSYEHIMKLRHNIARSVSKLWHDEGVVVPTNLKRNCFVTCAVDNIDESGQTEFHGTSLSMTSHISKEEPGLDPIPLTLSHGDFPKGPPEEYTNVPYCDEFHGDVLLTTNDSDYLKRTEQNDCATDCSQEEQWINHVSSSLQEDRIVDTQPLTFSGYFSANQAKSEIRPCASIGVFPVFFQKSNTMSMQKHAMQMLMEATEAVNPGQTTVIAADCPLYILQKKCQLKYPEEVGESKVVCFMGFLHIEMAALQCGGKLLGGSGWERMFNLSNIFPPGVASSLVGSSDVKRARYAYELTLVWLHQMKLEAYTEYCNSQIGPHEPIEVWEKRLIKRSPTVQYWTLVKQYLMLVFRFIHSQRTGDWTKCLSALDELCEWFFAFGQTWYARWLPVFLRDMKCLPETHPDIHKAFCAGKFVVQRSNTKFSMMGLDQSHEHSVKHLKSDGGCRGLYGSAEEKTVIEVSRPEMMRLVDEFEKVSGSKSDNITEHKEASTFKNKQFMNDAKALLALVTKGIIINPFSEIDTQLVNIDNGEIMDEITTKSLLGAFEIGKQLFETLWMERIVQCSKPLSDVVQKRNVFTFSNRPVVPKKSIFQSRTAASSSALTARLFLSLKARPNADMSDFFRHETQTAPPSLSNQGKLYIGTKSALLDCLPGIPPPGYSAKDTSVSILDMAALVHIIRPQRAVIFNEYMKLQLYPYIKTSFLTAQTTRVDAVWDCYFNDSVKNQTRSTRCRTATKRVRVLGNLHIPKGAAWVSFLSDSKNKEELHQYLADELMEVSKNESQLIITTKKETAMANQDINLTPLFPCHQEEADTRIMLHLKNASKDGHTKAYVRTVDTDVVILAISFFQQLGLEELWVGFGTGPTYKDIPVHELSKTILVTSHRPKTIQIQSLLFFHAFTGSDVTSAFKGIGKKSAWKVWQCYPEVTDTFDELTKHPHSLAIESSHMKVLERFTILLYSKNCSATRVNDAREVMFSSGLKSLESIPPTLHALFEHVKRTLYIVSFIWSQSLCLSPQVPSASEWGWEWNDLVKAWAPLWTSLPDVSKGCALLFKCSCIKACTGNCTCFRNNMKCSSLCKCQGGCTNNE